MWRRVRKGEFAEVLPQTSDVQPTSGQAIELASTHDVRQNVLRHLRQEIESSPGDRTFGAGIAETATIRLAGVQGFPNTDVSWTYLSTLFVVNVTENDASIEIAYLPNERPEETNFFQPLFFDNRGMDVWIDLRGYWGNESFITDAFVRPFHFTVGVFENGLNATLRFAHNTRNKVGTLIGRVLVCSGQPRQNMIANDFTMGARLARSESVYAARAAEVPRLEGSFRLIPEVDACAVWVHGTISCGLEGLKDLPTLPKIPMYRFEHDTFLEIGENASELARLIDKLGYQRTYILAHSRGGLVARFSQQILRSQYGRASNVITFGTPHRGTPLADAANGGLAAFMRAGDFVVNGIPYGSPARRMAGMFVGVELPPGIRAMQPTSEVLRTSALFLNQPFDSWAGVYQDAGGSLGYGHDIDNIISGIFGGTIEHDLVVPTLSALGGNQATRISCAHFDYFKNPAVQNYIASLI
jgi:pimeloyl-ACP methyl ester carboxylesterase